MKTNIVIIILLIISKISAQELVILMPNATCTNGCTGSINITIDPSLLDSDQTLPFDVEITNFSTQENMDYTMNQYQYLIDGAFFL